MELSKKTKNISGFTLIEVLASVSILVVLSTLVVANIHGANQRVKLDAAALKLVSDLRLVQDYSLGLRKYGVSDDYPSGGWGVRFTKANNAAQQALNTEYRIFADRDNTAKYRPSLDGNISTKELDSIVSLPAGVTISALEVNGTTNKNYLYIVFYPPDPMVYMNLANNENTNALNFAVGAGTEGSVTLSLAGTSLTKTIYFNRFGLIGILN